jgi:hypothetical protein
VCPPLLLGLYLPKSSQEDNTPLPFYTNYCTLWGAVGVAEDEVISWEKRGRMPRIKEVSPGIYEIVSKHFCNPLRVISSIGGEVFPENSFSKISLDNTKYCAKYRARNQI